MVAVHRMIISLGGALVAHQMGHVVASDHAHDAVHGYVGVALALVLPLAVLSFWQLALISARTGRDAIRASDLAVAQILIYLGQEATERALTAGTLVDLALDPVLWAGVAAQVCISGVLALSLRAARELFRPHIRAGWTARASSPDATDRPCSDGAPASQVRLLPLCRRGPPECVV